MIVKCVLSLRNCQSSFKYFYLYFANFTLSPATERVLPNVHPCWPCSEVYRGFPLLFNLHSLLTNDGEHIFMHLLVIYISSFVKCLFKSFTHFKNRVIFLSWLEISILYILDRDPLWDLCITNIFSLSVACLCIFLMVSLEVQQF